MNGANKEDDVHIPTFVEEDVDPYVDEVVSHVENIDEQVCKNSERFS